jgi:hypothetical protein
MYVIDNPFFYLYDRIYPLKIEQAKKFAILPRLFIKKIFEHKIAIQS